MVFFKKKSIIILLSALLFVVSINPSGNKASAASYDFYNLGTWPTVGYGYITSGGFVGTVQSVLWTNGFRSTVGTVDKSFSSNTYNGVVAFQKKYYLSADGRVGPGTWGKIESLTYNVDSNNREFRAGGYGYALKFVRVSSSTSVTHYYSLYDYWDTSYSYAYGDIWKDLKGATSSVELSTENNVELQKDLSEENAFVSLSEINKNDIHIPLHLNEKVNSLKGKPDVAVQKRDGGHAIITWYNIDEESPIMTSQSVNHLNDVDALLNEIKNVWYRDSETKELKTKGHSAILEITEHGHDSLHVITSDHIYTIAGAHEDILFEIAKQIDFK
ncbi:peptidoglycan-binding domain-containing protein [Fredinandcohnia humi]